MRVDPERAEAWYEAISDFLEQRAGEEDAESPGSLVTALCRVLVDAAEAVDAPEAKKLEAVAKLVASQMGFDDVLVLLGRDAPNAN